MIWFRTWELSMNEFPNQRCCAISYIRLLLDDSMLKAHQHKYRHEVDRVCDCGKGIEDVFHLLFSVQQPT